MPGAAFLARHTRLNVCQSGLPPEMLDQVFNPDGRVQGLPVALTAPDKEVVDRAFFYLLVNVSEGRGPAARNRGSPYPSPW